MKTDIPLDRDELAEWMVKKAEFYLANPLVEEPMPHLEPLRPFCPLPSRTEVIVIRIILAVIWIGVVTLIYVLLG